jgi:lipid-A-disaccharide synthase
VRKIRRAVDLLLTIFPFETGFLRRHGVPSHYVGHPLACTMPLQPDRVAAREALGLDPAATVLAILPGSRGGEVARLARPFLQSAQALSAEMPGLQLLVPLVNERTRAVVEAARQRCCPALGLRLSVGNSREVMAAADVVLTASGTATLEGLLSKRPMVVGYKLNQATYLMAHALRLVKVPHVAMANLLADERLAPEFIQRRCEPAFLVPALRAFLQDPARRESIARRYTEIHEQLRTDTNREAARAVIGLMKERGLV